MNALRIRAIAVLCLMILPWTAGATDVRFEQGSLIIPMQRAYQDECGVVAAYGLIFRLLQNHITVYWAVSPTKSSHHRCKNSVFTANTGTPAAADAKAMDGCDMTVASDTGFPVSLLDNTNAATKVSDTWKTYDTSSFAPNSTGEAKITVNKDQKYLRYMGGPFIIEAGQAAAARQLIQDHPDFANFRGPDTCYAGGGAGLGTYFHVNVHVANNAFQAPVARVMNEIPPPLALVKGDALAVLEGYLKNAGLSGPKNAGTCCDKDKHGLIYDVLDETTDLPSSGAYPYGKLNYAEDPTNPRKTFYQVVWAPHWLGDKSTPDKADKLKSTLANIAHFVDLGNSSFNECASIATYEDDVDPEPKGASFTFADNGPTRFFTGHLPSGADNPAHGVYSTQGEVSSASFASNGQDCSDTTTGDCYMYGDYSDLFTQKGDYKLTVASGRVESFKPKPGQDYESGYSRMFYTKSRTAGTAKWDNWDIFLTRIKDNNRQKGKVLYLGGHSFNTSAAGSRLVLNTLLNLAFRPDAQELSRSEPVSDVVYQRDGSGKVKHDDNGLALIDKTHILSGTFMNLEPQALFPERNRFLATKAEDWMFPYVQGRFRSILPEQIGTATQSYGKAFEWESDVRLPVPGKRQVFTVLGNNQVGLTRVQFELKQVTPGNCQDTLDTGTLKNVCDLEEAMGLDQTATGLHPLPDLDHDHVVDPGVTTADKDYNVRWNKHFVQRVLGYCVARDTYDNSIYTPTIDQCDNREFGEVVAHLGGLDHASAAVVGPSSYINNGRPDVAYIGGLDGQLHAIYLRGTLSTGATPQPGEELWSFIPQGQLSRLATNNARVDMSPVVSDVYVDYKVDSNKGTILPGDRHGRIFSWRTVLVAGAGRLGGELFALDVTDPLKPIVLWDVSATSYVKSTDPTTKTAITWGDNVDLTGPTPVYTKTPPVYTSAPTVFSDIYDYTNLGESLNMNLVPVRRGNRPTFQVIISSSGSGTGNHQINVFAIDAGSGAKFWEWQRLYTAAASDPTGTPTSNSVPGGTSTYDVDGDGNMDRVYVGDMEGKLWELSILTGANLNYFTPKGSGPPFSFALFDNATVNQPTPTTPQPISTLPAIMRIPYDLTDASSFTGMNRAAAGRLAFAFGTGGADWVLAKDAKAHGRVYVVASHQEDTVVRTKVTTDTSQVESDVFEAMKKVGTTKPNVVVQNELDEKERVVGSLKIVGSTILATTAYGNVDTNFTSELRGRTHLIDESKGTLNADTRPFENSGKSAAGALVLPDGSIVTQSMTGIQKTLPATVPLPKMGLPGKRTPVRVGSWLDTGSAFSE